MTFKLLQPHEWHFNYENINFEKKTFEFSFSKMKENMKSQKNYKAAEASHG
jgi:hypothetical protein